MIKNNIKRRNTRQVNVGGVLIGGDAPVSIQTMTKTKTADVKATVEQIRRCKAAGADIVRVTVNDEDAANAMKDIISQTKNIPVVADIHFNHVFAIKAIEAGVAKVRINPGNIGSEDRIKEVLQKAKEREIPIRIGVNSGSLEKDILAKYGHPTAEALFESAMRHVKIAEKFNFQDIVISVKSTSVPLMIDSYRLISNMTDFPLHLGVTEAGSYHVGTIKSSIGIGSLLFDGIGDTVRVSLTDEPEKEVEAAKTILSSLGLMKNSVEIISCPTCGRLETNLFDITRQLEAAVKSINKPLKVAVMGCAVNGPGEAKEADIGIACGKAEGLLFIRGNLIKKIPEATIVPELLQIIKDFKIEE